MVQKGAKLAAVSSTDINSELAGKGAGGRRLVAVVHADMAGYSRLIGMDDAGTIRRLRMLRRALIDPAIREHGGRVVQTGGDSLLIAFDSIDGAVRCSVKVQQQVPVYDGDQPPDRRIRFRIGINIADVIPDGTDLHGDGVNVAARLQAECPAGGICVSRAVRDHVHDRLGLVFEELGFLDLKNISRRTEAFLLRPAHAGDAPKSLEQSIGHGPSDALPLPEKPSLAVLAFTNMSGNPDQEYFSDGIADDIITELSRSRSLFVIARNSSFTYKGRAVDVKQVSRELGVRYIVEGGVRRSGNRIRVTAQLIDAETNGHIWAERFDRDVMDIFSVQDEITAAIAAAIQPAVEDAELRRVLRKTPENLGAWGAYQRGLWHLARHTHTDNEQAIELFQRAITLDVAMTSAYPPLVIAYIDSGQVYGLRSLAEVVRLADIWARKALDIDSNDAEIQMAMALVAQVTGRGAEAYERARLALTLNPESYLANAIQGALLIFDGQPVEGRSYLLKALRLNPRDPRGAARWNQVVISYYYERDYGGAVEASRRLLARYPGFPLTYRWLAASLGQLGRLEEARQALEQAMTITPKAFDLFVRSRVPWHRQENYEHMLEGLRKAGWSG
jgi:adenylate cyclase